MPSSRMIGVKPRPRALISGFDDNTTDRLMALFPTSRTIGTSLEDVQTDEWDVLVLGDGGVSWLPRHLFLIGFGCDAYGHPHQESGYYTIDYLVTYRASTLSQEFQVAEGLHPDVELLIERDLLPLARGRERNPVITESAEYVENAASPDAPWLTPFLTTSDHGVLAGRVLRSGEEAEAWCVPEGVADPVPWVVAAMRVWHSVDASRFPFDPGWSSEPRWMTLKEEDLLRSIDDVVKEREAYAVESALREERLRQEYAAAADEASRGRGRLLTANGAELVAGVQDALESLGFAVENRDLINPPNDLLEDLWVTSPDDPEWVALAEVKGYSGGAQLGALLSITGRFVPRFLESQGRYPSRSWYIANQFIGRDPGSRPPMLSGNPSELAEFESQHGMVLDTAVLFSLLKDVESGRLSNEEARAMLVSAEGRFRYEGDAGGDPEASSKGSPA
jgi:hypothetical protein